MRGRGTRTAPYIDKKKFVIYDFFGNHQHFNDSDTDAFSGAGGGGYVPKAQSPGGKSPRELIELGLEDEWLDAVHYIEVGPDGERVDKREYVTDWEKTVRQEAGSDPVLAKIRAGEALSEEEEEQLARRLNQPQRYFNEDNLRRASRIRAATSSTSFARPLGFLNTKHAKNEWRKTSGLGSSPGT